MNTDKLKFFKKRLIVVLASILFYQIYFKESKNLSIIKNQLSNPADVVTRSPSSLSSPSKLQMKKKFATSTDSAKKVSASQDDYSSILNKKKLQYDQSLNKKKSTNTDDGSYYQVLNEELPNNQVIYIREIDDEKEAGADLPGNFNNVSFSDTINNNTGDNNFLTVEAIPGAGTYNSFPIVTISSSSSVIQINYCLSPTVTCCNPNVPYSSSIPIISATNPGLACLSIEGISDSGKKVTRQVLYSINDSAPAIAADFEPQTPLILQTNQTASLVPTDGDFGNDNTYYYVLALGSTDPMTVAGGCSEKVAAFDPEKYAIESKEGIFIENVEGKGLSVGHLIGVHNGLYYYNSSDVNHFIIVMERLDDLGNSSYTCLYRQIALSDFPFFNLSTVDKEVFEKEAHGLSHYQGSIHSFGPFGGLTSGSGQSNSTKSFLKSGFINILN